LHCAIVTRAAVLMFPLLLQTIISNQMKPRRLRGIYDNGTLSSVAGKCVFAKHAKRLYASRITGMHELRTIATDGPVAWCVCQSACSCTDRSPASDGPRNSVFEDF